MTQAKLNIKDLPEEFKGYPKDRQGMVKEEELTTTQKIAIAKVRMLKAVTIAGEQAQLKNIMAQMGSPVFLANEIAKDEVTRIKTAIDFLKEMGVNVSAEYGFNEHINLLIRYARAVHYTSELNKDLIYSSGSVSPITVENLVNSAGSAPYYSEKYDSIVEASPTDVSKLADSLKALALELGLTGNITTGALTAEAIQDRNDKAMEKATRKKENTAKLATKQFSLGTLVSEEDGDSPMLNISDINEDESKESDIPASTNELTEGETETIN